MSSEIKNIAVIGAGDLGRRLAYAALLGGYTVMLEDVSTSRLEEALRWIARELAQGISRGEIAEHLGCDTFALPATVANVHDAIRDADLIIEAVAEELEMKMELFTIFDKFAKPEAIFASTSALCISDMSELTVVRERCIGMRFTSAEQGLLVLVRTALTSEETENACAEVGRRFGKAVSIVAEVCGQERK